MLMRQQIEEQRAAAKAAARRRVIGSVRPKAKAKAAAAPPDIVESSDSEGVLDAPAPAPVTPGRPVPPTPASPAAPVTPGGAPESPGERTISVDLAKAYLRELKNDKHNRTQNRLTEQQVQDRIRKVRKVRDDLVGQTKEDFTRLMDKALSESAKKRNRARGSTD